MINTYCENLKDTFAELVYYGILREEDAQCFRVEARVESASYFLAGAAVALALLNTFVIRAVNQYFRDIDATTKEFKAVPGRDGEEVEGLAEAVRRIRPVPVLFTDAFRWFLVREDSDPSRRIFVSQDGQDRGMIHITEEIPVDDDGRDIVVGGGDLMAGTMQVEPVEPSPLDTRLESVEYDDYDDDYEEYFEDHVPPSPHPRQPEILPTDDVLSREAVHDSNSNSACTSLETPQEGGLTVLSCVSELTPPPTEPWMDV